MAPASAARAARAAQASPGVAPSDTQAAARPRLKQQEKTASLQRRARRSAMAAAAVIAAVLLIVVAGQAMVASQQVRIDNMHTDLAAAVSANENLQLTRAQLEAPGRILILAQHQLHMVVPKTVTYLNPVKPGPSLADVRAEGK
jgi:hypothetical protein